MKVVQSLIRYYVRLSLLNIQDTTACSLEKNELQTVVSVEPYVLF